jgi:alpha/beta superfamily hydrolase
MEGIFKSIDGIELEYVSNIHQSGKGKVLLIHGITVDMHEGGMYDRLAVALFNLGYSTMQFSFRGHGKSEGTQEGMTIAGEMLDLLSAIRYFQDYENEEIQIIASSFGAVPTSIIIDSIAGILKNLVLWNPVLDLNNTFLQPTMEWGINNFCIEKRKIFQTQDFLLIDDNFKAGKILFKEFLNYNPKEYLIKSGINTLIIHGDKDTYVSYKISKEVSERSDKIELITIAGSDHGFDSKEKENHAIESTIKWLEENIN